MNIVFLGRSDPANTSNRVAWAIRKMGGNARVVTETQHPFDYHIKDLTVDQPEAKQSIAEADWLIHSGDADYPFFFQHLKGAKARLGTRHAGVQYRDNPEWYDKLDDVFERRFFACDLYRFAKGDKRARVYVQPMPSIADAPTPPEKILRVCHTPSDRIYKGTRSVIAAMRPDRMGGARVEFILKPLLPYPQILDVRRRCQVLIDQNVESIGGYGAAAMEAMAEGLVVVSNCNKVVPEVDSMIPRPPILMVRSEDDITETIRRLATDRDYLQSCRQASLDWARKHLSPEFTFEYWGKCLK